MLESPSGYAEHVGEIIDKFRTEVQNDYLNEKLQILIGR